MVRDHRRPAAARQAGAHPIARRTILKDDRPAPSRIRRYSVEDETAVVDVWHRSGRAAYTYLPTWQAFDRADALRVFRTSVAILCEIWVAEEGDRVVGFLAMRHGSYIDRLYVEPEAQRRGWGTRLLEHARKLSPAGLELHTHVENHAARALYEKYGFVAVRFGTSPAPESAPDVEYHWRPGTDDLTVPGEAPHRGRDDADRRE